MITWELYSSQYAGIRPRGLQLLEIRFSLYCIGVFGADKIYVNGESVLIFYDQLPTVMKLHQVSRLMTELDTTDLSLRHIC